MSIIPPSTRFIGISERVDLTERKSSYINNETEPYTMDDIASTVAVPFVNSGLYSQTANSPVVTNTTTESSLVDGGIGGLAVPANGFSVGDSFRVKVCGVISCANNQTIIIKVKAGSLVLLDSGAQTITNISNDAFILDIDFTIRAIGAPGSASIISVGKFSYTKTVNGNTQAFAFNTLNNTTFDTTISNTLDVTVQWGAADPINSIYSNIFILNKTF